MLLCGCLVVGGALGVWVPEKRKPAAEWLRSFYLVRLILPSLATEDEDEASESDRDVESARAPEGARSRANSERVEVLPQPRTREDLQSILRGDIDEDAAAQLTDAIFYLIGSLDGYGVDTAVRSGSWVQLGLKSTNDNQVPERQDAVVVVNTVNGDATAVFGTDARDWIQERLTTARGVYPPFRNGYGTLQVIWLEDGSCEAFYQRDYGDRLAISLPSPVTIVAGRMSRDLQASFVVDEYVDDRDGQPTYRLHFYRPSRRLGETRDDLGIEAIVYDRKTDEASSGSYVAKGNTCAAEPLWLQRYADDLEKAIQKSRGVSEEVS